MSRGVQQCVTRVLDLATRIENAEPIWAGVKGEQRTDAANMLRDTVRLLQRYHAEVEGGAGSCDLVLRRRPAPAPNPNGLMVPLQDQNISVRVRSLELFQELGNGADIIGGGQVVPS